MPELELVTRPDLSIVSFRLRYDDDADSRNARLANARFFASTTRIDGRLVLRAAGLSFRTHRRHLDQFLSTLTNTAIGLG